jgi:Ca-activated chloride channel homolog
MKNKSSIIELILAASVLIAFFLTGCYSTTDNRSRNYYDTTMTSQEYWASRKTPKNVTNIPRTNLTPIAEDGAGRVGLQGGTAPDKAYGFARTANAISTTRSSTQSQMHFSQSEELWIISRPTRVAQINDDQYPGTGALVTKRAEKEIPLPLKHTDVKAKVNGYIATVEVTQQFHNPYDSKIEAVYVFPLPENSAVNEFVMIIGERQIRGIIREREEAERIYKEARSQGYVASMMTEERPNIFTQSVANIEPGKQIDVNIKYYNTLAYMDGWFEFAFPMVVGPRFNPPGSTKGVGAVGRGATGASGQSTEVTYLRPGERSGHDIALEVEIDAGVATS